MIKNLKVKLENKDKQIEEVIENYETNIQQNKEEHLNVLNMRLEQFQVVNKDSGSL